MKNETTTMKHLKTLLTITAATCALASSATASIDIATSYVGNPNNPGATQWQIAGKGSVGYGYHVGTHEVTNNQYVSFLNAKAATDPHGLWNPQMGAIGYANTAYILRTGSDGNYTYNVRTDINHLPLTNGNKPVNWVSFWDAARFTNWLTNGQGSGDTETGVYNLGGVTNPTEGTITRNAAAWGAGGVAIANPDEWHKAAYYDPNLNGGEGGHWQLPGQTNDATNAWEWGQFGSNQTREVGLGLPSYYGTYDQGGNVAEWQDTGVGDSYVKGGYFGQDGTASNAKNLIWSLQANELTYTGFRVTSLGTIPEPSSYAAMFGCLALTVAIIRRKGRRTL